MSDQGVPNHNAKQGLAFLYGYLDRHPSQTMPSDIYPRWKIAPKKPTGISILVNSPKHLPVKNSLPRKSSQKNPNISPADNPAGTFPQMPAEHYSPRAACYTYVTHICIYRRQKRAYKHCPGSSLPPKLFCPIHRL